MKQYFRYHNVWNIIFAALVVWVFVGGYTEGLWNAINCVIMVLAFFMLGRASLDRELEILLNKARDEMASDATQN